MSYKDHVIRTTDFPTDPELSRFIELLSQALTVTKSEIERRELEWKVRHTKAEEKRS